MMQTTSLRNAIAAIATSTALLLLIPLMAMQFTREVSWGTGDFLAAGALLFGAGCAILWACRRVRQRLRRRMVVAVICLAVALLWAELAVGLFR
jgi:NhaP-type Na+/H+ or K+/H+ antiporter